MLALLLNCGVAFAADSGDLVQVLQTQWGFDGNVVRKSFVPLSVELRNISSKPWSGKLQLVRSAGETHQIDAVLEIAVSLQGEEARWVQLVPYVFDEQETWTLRWGDNPRRVAVLPAVTVGPSPTVLIYDPDAVFPTIGVLRRFSETQFPTSLAGTDTLRGLIFDTPPFWQGARAQVFLDWLQAGGRVYLLHNSDGAFPVFTVPLQQLNQLAERFHIGSGTVIRIPRRAEDLKLTDAQGLLFNDDLPQGTVNRPNQSFGIDAASDFWERDESIFRALAESVKFRRNWWLIDASVAAYLLAIGPICYRIGYRLKNVRLFYIVFFGAAFTFSVVFWLLGQLGANAHGRIASAALAEALGNGRYNVTQWSQLAEAAGGEVSLTHGGSGIWYTTCQEYEKVNGVLRGGQNPEVVLNMPPASTRTLLHRETLALRRPEPKLVSASFDVPTQPSLSISIDGCFDSSPQQAWAILGGKAWPLKPKEGLLQIENPRGGVSLRERLQTRDDWNMTIFGVPRTRTEMEERLPVSERLLWPLLGNSYGLTDLIDPRLLAKNSGLLRLAVLTTMPREFLAETSSFPDQQGLVLFVYDLPVSGQ